MSAEVWSAIGAGVAGVAALASVYVAWRAIRVSRDVADTQVKLSQRQLLLPLWQYMAELKNVDPTKPVVPDVVKVVNTLELVALCVEGEMVDGQIIRRTFRDGFVTHFDQVKACGPLPNMNGKTGMDLLRENRAALSLYERLMEEHRKQDEAMPLKGRSK